MTDSAKVTIFRYSKISRRSSAVRDVPLPFIATGIVATAPWAIVAKDLVLVNRYRNRKLKKIDEFCRS